MPFYWLTRDVAQLRYPPSPGRILGTQTFRVAGVLHFTYTQIFRVAGVCILPTHTFGAILKQNWEKWIQSWNIFRAARALLLKQSIRKLLIYWNISELRARPLSFHWKMRGRFGEKCRFSKKKIEFGWPSYMKIFRAARAAFIISLKNGGTIWRKWQFSKWKIEFGWPLKRFYMKHLIFRAWLEKCVSKLS